MLYVDSLSEMLIRFETRALQLPNFALLQPLIKIRRGKGWVRDGLGWLKFPNHLLGRSLITVAGYVHL